MEGLTARQKQVLQGIHNIYTEKGYPPTVREIGEQLGLSSSCTVQRHLDALERKGYIRRNHTKARSVEIVQSFDPAMVRRPMVSVPLLGTVTAGQPILAAENIEDVIGLPTDLLGQGEHFMLRVRGESMVGAGLFDGDLVVVRQQSHARSGDIVVALLEGEEATIKRLFKESGRVRLQPENPSMQPIISNKVSILGKVVLGIRRF
jgi:repressor LexA